MATRIELKRGTLGDVIREATPDGAVVIRDSGAAPHGRGWLARSLARREARALERLAGLAGIPELISCDSTRLARTWLAGEPMHVAQPRSRAYFRSALRLLRQMHRRGVTHNDVAKEANWLCLPDGNAGLVDFQLAICFRRHSRLFRTLAREDLRHLLKHKRCYCPERLTRRERRLLDNPLWPARVWRAVVKPVYRLVTRRLLGWQERTGPEERERSAEQPGRKR